MRYGYIVFYNERTGETMTKIRDIAIAATSLSMAFSSPVQAENIRHAAPAELLTEFCPSNAPKIIVYMGAADQGQPKFLQCATKTVWWAKKPEEACGDLNLLMVMVPRDTKELRRNMAVIEEAYNLHCKGPALQS